MECKVCLKVCIVFFVRLFVVGWYGVEVIWWMLLDLINVWNFLEINCVLLLLIICFGILNLVNKLCRILIVEFEEVDLIGIIFGYLVCVLIIIKNIEF